MGDPVQFERQRIQRFFDDKPRFVCERELAHGADGITFLIVDREPSPPMALPTQPANRVQGQKRVRSLTPTNIARAAIGAIGSINKRVRVSIGGSSAIPSVPDAPVGPADVSINSSPRASDSSPHLAPVRYCLKRSIGSEGPENMQKEASTLRRINGGAHIVKLVNFRNDPTGRARRMIKMFKKRPLPSYPWTEGHFIIGLGGPSLLLEYLEGGNVNRLITRMNLRVILTPNRLIWAIYLSIRACIAMRFPNAVPDRGRTALEEIPQGRQPSTLSHYDIHILNVMFGNLEPNVLEHSLIPIMKLIDFSQAQEMENSLAATQLNLLQYTDVIYRIIVRDNENPTDLLFENRPPKFYKGIRTYAVKLADDRDIPHVYADRHVTALDDDLRELICLSMAWDPLRRPTISTCLRRCADAVANKTADSFAGKETNETDEYIQRCVQRVIYDARRANEV
ncbi:hypothetical protein HD806DRAFT_520716 [Xylariaceae sp. AK1471]|nr:hypothetical protein HD806DRAFT_520716 [Xylariaceae sp. AK1471]